MLPRLVQRFCSPIVVSAATKEGLCLTLASVAQLFPYAYPSIVTSSSANGLPPSNGLSEILKENEMSALVSRAVRLAPSCSGRELGMLASGSASLGCRRTSLVDTLARELLWHCEKQAASSQEASPHAVRLPDVVHLLHAAMAAQSVYNATAAEVVVRHAPALLRRRGGKERVETVEALVCAAQVYFGGGSAAKATVQALRDAARDAGLTKHASVLSEDAVAVLCARSDVSAWTAHRRSLMKAIAESGSSDNMDGGSGSNRDASVVASSSTSGRADGEWRVRQRLCELASSTQTGAPQQPKWMSADSLMELLQAVAYYRIIDPVGLRALETVAWGFLITASPTDARRVSDAAFAHQHCFPTLCARLHSRNEQGDGSPEGTMPNTVGGLTPTSKGGSLQHVSLVRQVFFALQSSGQQPSEETLVDISSKFSNSQPDDLAFTVAIFATLKEIPVSMASAVAAAEPHLSLAGTAALLWAARKDQSGSLLGAAAAAMRRWAAGTALHDAVVSQLPTLDAVAALCEAVHALPRPRHVHLPEPFLSAEAVLAQTLADVLVELALTRPEDQGPSLDALLQLAARTGNATEGVAEFISLLCDRVSKEASAGLSHQQCLLAMTLFCAHDGLVHEALADRIAQHLQRIVTAVADPNLSNADTAMQCLAAIRLYTAWDGSELEGAALELLHVVQRAVTQTHGQHAEMDVPSAATSPEALTAAALVAMHVKRPDAAAHLASSLATELARLAQEGTWVSQVCLEGGAALLHTLSDARPREAVALMDGLTLHLPQWLPAPPPCAACPHSPVNMAASLAAAYCRLCSGTAFFEENSSGTWDSWQTPSQPLPDVVVAYLEQHLLVGVSADAFTVLCESLYRAGATVAPFAAGLSNAVVAALPRVLDRLSTEQMARCLWGLGQLPDAGQRLSHQLMTEAASDYVLDNADLFWSGPDVARMLFGFARLHCTKRSLYSVFCARLSLRPVRATMNREAVGLVLSALGTVKFLDKDLFDRFATAYARHAPTLSAADVLQSVKAHSRVMLRNDAFYANMAHEIVQRPASAFPLAAKCELLHAYGAVDRSDDTMAARLVAGVAQDVEKLPSANATVDVLTSLWLMDYPIEQDENVKALVDHVVQHAEGLTSTSLLKLSSLLADRTWRQPALLQALGDQCVRLRLSEDLSPEAARASLDVLAQYRFHHRRARQEVASLARSVSREAPQLSEEEEEQLNMLITR